jgi:hypothetical protein
MYLMILRKFVYIRPFLKRSGPITIYLKGVECMNDDPSKVNILYVKPHDEKGYLQELVQQVSDYFIDQGKDSFTL